MSMHAGYWTLGAQQGRPIRLCRRSAVQVTLSRSGPMEIALAAHQDRLGTARCNRFRTLLTLEREF